MTATVLDLMSLFYNQLKVNNKENAQCLGEIQSVKKPFRTLKTINKMQMCVCENPVEWQTVIHYAIFFILFNIERGLGVHIAN